MHSPSEAQNIQSISHLFGDFHCFQASADALQRSLKSIISPFDVFYSKNGTFALSLHGCEHERRAAAQILREKLRRIQLRRTAQMDSIFVLTQLRTELFKLSGIAEAVFENRLGKVCLSLCPQLRGKQHRHRVGRKAGIWL